MDPRCALIEERGRGKEGGEALALLVVTKVAKINKFILRGALSGYFKVHSFSS